jgi:predicted metal-dependent peptidase
MALAEIDALLTRAGLRAGQLRVLAVDPVVHTVGRVTRANQVRLAGGGGTDMGEGIRAAAALRPRPSIVVVLTDGYTPWPQRPPKGIRVVVGRFGGSPIDRAAPGWARVVDIPG